MAVRSKSDFGSRRGHTNREGVENSELKKMKHGNPTEPVCSDGNDKGGKNPHPSLITSSKGLLVRPFTHGYLREKYLVSMLILL